MAPETISKQEPFRRFEKGLDQVTCSPETPLAEILGDRDHLNCRLGEMDTSTEEWRDIQVVLERTQTGFTVTMGAPNLAARFGQPGGDVQGFRHNPTYKPTATLREALNTVSRFLVRINREDLLKTIKVPPAFEKCVVKGFNGEIPPEPTLRALSRGIKIEFPLESLESMDIILAKSEEEPPKPGDFAEFLRDLRRLNPAIEITFE